MIKYKEKKRTWNHIDNTTEVRCVKIPPINTSQVKHLRWEMIQVDPKSMGLYHI